MTTELDQSFQYCHNVLTQSGSSFRWAIYILPRLKRRGLKAAYAFLRLMDDLAEQEDLTDLQRLEQLNQLRNWRNLDLPFVPAMIETSDRFRIPDRCFDEALDGVISDVRFQPFQTRDQLNCYCHQVAGTVGEICVCIWGVQNKYTNSTDAINYPEEETACLKEVTVSIERQARAVQMTNILRDIREDAQRHRVYLPEEVLETFGWTTETFLRQLTTSNGLAIMQEPAALHRFRRLIMSLIETIESDYQASSDLQTILSPDGRLSNPLIRNVYHKILIKIKKQPEIVLTQRVRLSGLQKIILLIKLLRLF